jgi:hypothetical protein
MRPLRIIGHLAIMAGALTLSGCYMANFFKRSASTGAVGNNATFSGTVVGQPIGATAGTQDTAALESVYAITTTHAPAAVRPDPDLYVRNMIRQYRPESETVADQVGQVEQFRPMLGGAPSDFSTPPQATYDATSLLAVSAVATQVCQGLVAPNNYSQPGWATIMPYPADQEQANILWLAQRMTGKPSASIDPSVVPSLTTIMQTEEPYLQQDGLDPTDPYSKYVPVCAALALSTEALYL